MANKAKGRKPRKGKKKRKPPQKGTNRSPQPILTQIIQEVAISSSTLDEAQDSGTGTADMNVTTSNILKPGLRDRDSALPPSPTPAGNEEAAGEDGAGVIAVAEADGSKSSGNSSMSTSEIDPGEINLPNPSPTLDLNPGLNRKEDTPIRGKATTKAPSPCSVSPSSSKPKPPPSSKKSTLKKTPLKAKKKSRKQPPPSKRYRPPSNVLQEIRKYQCSTKLLIPKLPIQRLIREITYRKTGNCQLRYQGAALAAIHAAAEAFLVGLMEDSYLASLHSKRVTLMQKDIILALRIRGDPDYFKI